MGVVVMVDVYGPTSRLAQGYSTAGYAIARVRSTIEVPPMYRDSADEAALGLELAADITHIDFETTLAAVAALDPVAVVVGGESGVELADRLAETLGLPGNGTEHSAARRDKFKMIELLARQGLRATDHILVTDEHQLHEWHTEIGGPVVVKPARSAGNDNVHFCHSAAESVGAYRTVRAGRTLFGESNDLVVAQRFLIGGEYVVNSVSCAGIHRITDVWRYVKISANGVSDRVAAATSVDFDDPRTGALTEYAENVLDTFGIRYGPAHLEIMMTPDGPTLVEIGARLCGADTARYAGLAWGTSQVEWSVAAFTDPARFHTMAGEPVRRRNYAAMAFLTAPRAGTLVSYPRLDEVRALPSYHDHTVVVRPGQRLHRTVSDVTEPMMIGLVHPIADVLDRDLATVNYLDGDGFYEIVTDACDADWGDEAI
ncbi:ATP-grasp domain-containing protein [Mycolicibacterium neoaurum]|uniref:ATP-grasp domain-containing protein n=1 Tax=Mycolicibacterium neoaurum TaxID=1795 RepID=UPI002671A079|nr:ATP-grasp domain-containing protein [Mycolicibacterium neoaurum]MDO3399918.1 ATP-grasp domain-containing protein [Mycolicibacterium neoaurum]